MYYELIGKSNDKDKYKPYNIKDSNGRVMRLSREEILDIIKNGEQINGLYLDSIGRIRQKHLKNTDTTMDMEILSGKELKQRCISDVGKFVKRSNVKNIVEFCKSDIYDRVYIIYGLRRTGKTVLIKHSALELLKDKRRVYMITINSDISARDLLNTINRINNAVVFIDEVTRVKDIISVLNILVDTISSRNRIKIVLTGTDSYVFSLANQTSLFGRAFYYHSTIISYSEYSRVTGQRLKEYMSDGSLFGGLYTDRSIVNNINGSIIGNIVNTLEKNKEFLDHNAIYGNITHIDKSTLGAIIYYILVSACDTKFKRNMNSIASRKLGQEKVGFLSRVLNESAENIPKFIGNISNNTLLTVISILEQLDVVKEVPNIATGYSEVKAITDIELCITQPGLLWSLLHLFNNSSDIRIGKATENLVILSLISMSKAKKYNIVEVGYLKYEYLGKEHEIDIAVRINDNETFQHYRTYIEVKSGDKKHPEYTKHLRNKALFKTFGQGKRIVVYNGITDTSEDIKWVNIEDFILNPWNYIV